MATYKAVILKGEIHTKQDGTSNVKIRITHKGKVAYISTGLYTNLDFWDNKQGILTSGPNKNFINLRIGDLIQNYRRMDMELGNDINYMTVSKVKKHLTSGIVTVEEIDFLKFIKNFSNSVKVLGTKEQYLSLMASLKSFSGDRLPVSEINLSYLMRYEAFLLSRGVQNGIINYMRTFRSLFNKCRDHYNDEDSNKILIQHYPFKKYSFPKRKVNSKEHVLSLNELQLLLKYSPVNDGEQFAKDMFLLMFYLIGIEAKDLFFLEKSHLGRITYSRFKTGREYSIKLEPEALEIIERYKGNKLLLNISENFQHNKSFFRKVNNYLSGEKAHQITGILTKIKIKKQVTTKWARHTWATIARNDCRINKDNVALCLGHEDSDNKVTDMYIKYDHSIIDECNRKVIDLITHIPHN